MRICFAGWGHSIHTRVYCEWFARRGHDCFLLTDHVGEIDGVRQVDIGQTDTNGSSWKRLMCGGINTRFLQDLGILLRARRFLKELRPNIIHLHTLIHPNELIALASMGLSIPFVVMPWNGDLLWVLDRSWWQRRMVPWLVKRSELGLYNSKELKQTLKDCGLIEEKLLSYLGVDISYFDPKNSYKSHVESMGISSERPIVLSTRSLGDFYRLDLIVKSIMLVKETVPKVLFIFCWHWGPTAKEEAFRKLLNEHGVGSSVLILGKQSQEVLQKLFRAAHIVVSMSEKDSMPRSILEAMASGTVPIVAQHPGVCELAKNEETALIVPQGDHIALAKATIRLLTDSVLRRRLSRNARKLVEDVADQDKNLSIIEKRYYEIVHGKEF
jgi:L-malate glycosyltransferase